MPTLTAQLVRRPLAAIAAAAAAAALLAGAGPAAAQARSPGRSVGGARAVSGGAWGTAQEVPGTAAVLQPQRHLDPASVRRQQQLTSGPDQQNNRQPHTTCTTALPEEDTMRALIISLLAAQPSLPARPSRPAQHGHRPARPRPRYGPTTRPLPLPDLRPGPVAATVRGVWRLARGSTCGSPPMRPRASMTAPGHRPRK
jgi:hypothetical protein